MTATKWEKSLILFVQQMSPKIPWDAFLRWDDSALKIAPRQDIKAHFYPPRSEWRVTKQILRYGITWIASFNSRASFQKERFEIVYLVLIIVCFIFFYIPKKFNVHFTFALIPFFPLLFLHLANSVAVFKLTHIQYVQYKISLPNAWSALPEILSQIRVTVYSILRNG